MAKPEKCYSMDQVHSLAQREVSCQKCEADSSIIKQAYADCVSTSKPPETLSDKLKGEFLGYTVSFGFGVLVAATHCFGLCK